MVGNIWPNWIVEFKKSSIYGIKFIIFFLISVWPLHLALRAAWSRQKVLQLDFCFWSFGAIGLLLVLYSLSCLPLQLLGQYFMSKLEILNLNPINKYKFYFQVIIYRTSFDEIQRSTVLIWFALDYFADFIYLMDILIHFRTGIIIIIYYHYYHYY